MKAQTPLQFFLSSLAAQKVKTGLVLLGETLQACFLIMVPFAVKDIVNVVQAFDHDSGASLWESLETPFFSFLGMVFIANFFARFSGGVLVFLAPSLRLKPRTRLIKYLQTHSVNYFQSSHSGALGNKVNDACNGMAMSLWGFLFDVWPLAIMLISSLFLFSQSNPTIALIFLCWASLYILVMFRLAVMQSSAMEGISNERSRITGQVVDLATNIQSVKSFAQEDFEKERLRVIMDDERKAILKFQVIREAGGYFHSSMVLAIHGTMMWFILNAFEQGTATLGDVAFIFSILLIVTEQIRGLSWALMNFLEYVGQMRDGVKTIMKPHILLDKKEASELTITTPSVHFSNVNFHYTDNKSKTVFENLELKIPAYQKVGLVGPSGAGKTTLVNLIMRFYDVQSGQILLDGHDVKDVTQQSLRKNIAVIPQDTALFHRSLMENIRYGRLEATDEDVFEAAKKAYAHDFISELPMGYDTMVGERGVRLSGGQRQRIAIARAILKDAPILVLDEATSALDSESELLIQQALQSLMEGKTVLAIAHRLSTIASLDRLIVMQNGAIVEDGKHESLIAKNGLYAKLWRMQSGGFLKEKKES